MHIGADKFLHPLEYVHKLNESDYKQQSTNIYGFYTIKNEPSYLYLYFCVQRQLLLILRSKSTPLPSFPLHKSPAACIFSSSTMKSEIVIYCSHEHTKASTRHPKGRQTPLILPLKSGFRVLTATFHIDMQDTLVGNPISP